MLIPKAFFKVATLLLLLIANYFTSLEAFALYQNLSHVNAVRCIEKERQALLKFKDGLEDPDGLLSSWSGSDCCAWKGVVCRHPTGEVLKLDLSNPNCFYFFELDLNNSLMTRKHSSSCLVGKLSHYLDELEHLSYLNLSFNEFSGMIPPQLGNLSNLRVLDLYKVGYDSYVSDLNWISRLSSLKFLDLSYLNLSLATTHWLQAINNIPSLVELHLANSQLQSVPLFLSRSNLTSLSVLDLSSNNFSTQAPQWLINITTSVVVLKLSECYFRGPISSLFGGSLFPYNHNYNLEELDLSHNGFSGELPDSFGHLKSLRTLDLTSNSISGPLPTSIGRLSKLENLSLYYNKMNGSIPKSLGRLGELKILDLFNNEWEGILSQDHFQGLSKLKELYISSRNGAFDLNNLSRNWVPPFSLEIIMIQDLDLGPEFPTWLQTQTQLVQIYLSNVSISVTIPSWLWKLSPRIQELDLSHNQLRGTIPTSLVFSSDAAIDLSSNFLHGRLPLWRNVSHLYLNNNTFSGPIPVKIGQIMSSLTYLDLSENSLNGSIPSSVGKMNNLDFLFLSNNQLSGKVHDNWMNKFILSIDLSNNNLTGKFPASLCSLPELIELNLSNNTLFGKLSSSLKNCKNLQLLDLGENKFSGSIPKWIGENHTSLIQLSIRGNLFNGSISEQICGLQSLRVLDLAQNNFSGPIPTCLSQLNGMKSIEVTPYFVAGLNMDLNLKGIEYTYDHLMLLLVRVIDLSCNNLAGLVPEDITSLTGLGTLNLSNNHLTGKIPSRIGEMKNLETLDLSSNHFYGQIPPSMSSMTFLVHLNLSYNNLSGRIPLGNQFSTFDESIYEGNSGLCGSPLPTECGPLVVQEEGGDDHDEEDDGKLGLFVSVALGFIFGFWSICGSLVIKKSWRDAYYGFLDKTKDWIMMVVAMNLNRLRRMIARMGN